MAQINRNRLHLLVSSLCGVAALGLGMFLVFSVYSPFKDQFLHKQYIQVLEQRTGKSYTQWQEEQSVRCSKEVAESKDTGGGVYSLYPEEHRAHLYQICMSVPITSLIPDSAVWLAFASANALWALGYVLTAAFSAWFVGFLVAKALPRAVSQFWGWLTSSEGKS